MSLTCDRLREVLAYDANTGVFTWLVTRGGGFAGDIAGGRVDSSGHLQISVDGRRYGAHRLAWLYVFGCWPLQEIDHKDGIKTNNAIGNLRDVSRRVNQQNLRKANRFSSTGLLGVTPLGDRFMAQICAKGASRYLGVFDTAEEAHTAYVNAKRVLHVGCTI